MRKHVLYFLIVLCGCIQPIDLDVNNQSGQIVVEGSLTTAGGPHEIRISESIPFDSLIKFLPIRGANVKIMDGSGGQATLKEVDPGVYQTAPRYQGTVGQTYQLEVVLPNGEVLQTDPQLIQPNPGIDSVYAQVSNRETVNGTQLILRPFLSFRVDLPEISGAQYFRYDWELIYEVLQQRPAGSCDLDYEVPLKCYRSELPEQYINTLLVNPFGSESAIKNHEVALIDPNRRLQSKMSIEVSQYALTKDIYDYWEFAERLLKNNGGLFDPIPGRLDGNIYYRSDPERKVLGVFEVASVAKKRIFILPSALEGYAPVHFDCECKTGGSFCLNPLPDIPVTCCDCRVFENSTAIKPDFWQ